MEEVEGKENKRWLMCNQTHTTRPRRVTSHVRLRCSISCINTNLIWDFCQAFFMYCMREMV